VKDRSAFPSNKAEDEYIEYATSLAQWLEWGGKGDQSIDTWFRLALLGREDAWARCSEIYEDVLRTDDFTTVLAWRHGRGKDREKTIVLADLMLEAGRTPEAVKLYEQALEIEADDAPILRALGRIHAQDCEWAKSQHAFERLISLKPTDIEAGLGYADALIHQGQTEQAADQYVRLSATHITDHHVHEVCAVLCCSLGRMTESMLAMQRLVACPEHESSPEDYLELAHLYRSNGDAPGQIAALRQGMGQFADSTRIRLVLGETLAGLEEHDEAIAVLAHPSLSRNVQAIHDILAEALYAQNPAPALRFIGTALPDSLNKDPATRLDFALLHERIGKTSIAQHMVDDLIKDGTLRETTVWRDLAMQAMQTGRINMAEVFLTHYLSTRKDEHDSKAWEILGDIYSAQDREDEALSAYKKAVETIQPPPAAPAPAGPQVKVSQN
jgi:tetratricopeptide (TPR) repeat protein